MASSHKAGRHAVMCRHVLHGASAAILTLIHSVQNTGGSWGFGPPRLTYETPSKPQSKMEGVIYIYSIFININNKED